MARRATARRKSGVTSVDLSKVEGRVLVEEGEYLVEVDNIEEKEGNAAPYLAWQFKIIEGDFEGSKLYNNTSLAEQSLWNLRTLLEALGVEIPNEAMDIDHEEMKGLELMVAVEHETYEGKKRPRIVDFWAVEKKPTRSSRSERGDKGGESARSERGSSRDDRRSARGSSKNTKPGEKVTQDQINDMDQDELEELIKELELDVDLSKYRTLRKMQAAVIDAAEKAEVLED